MTDARHPSVDVLLRGFLGGAANGLTMIVTNPLDVLKIRSQTGGEMSRGPRLSVPALGSSIVHREGGAALFKGLSVSILRELTFSSVRLGLYEPIKTILSGSDSMHNLSLGGKIIAGVLSGGIAASFFNPTDVLKGSSLVHQ